MMLIAIWEALLGLGDAAGPGGPPPLLVGVTFGETGGKGASTTSESVRDGFGAAAGGSTNRTLCSRTGRSAPG